MILTKNIFDVTLYQLFLYILSKTVFIFELRCWYWWRCQWWPQSGAVVRRCSVKELFLEISQNSQQNTCARVSFLIKLQEHHLLQNTSGGCFCPMPIFLSDCAFSIMSNKMSKLYTLHVPKFQQCTKHFCALIHLTKKKKKKIGLYGMSCDSPSSFNSVYLETILKLLDPQWQQYRTFKDACRNTIKTE